MNIIGLTITNFEYVINIANVLILALATYFCSTIVSGTKAGAERGLYNLLFLVMIMLMVGQLVNVLQRFGVIQVPGGASLAYIVASSALLYKMLTKQTRWKVE